MRVRDLRPVPLLVRPEELQPPDRTEVVLDGFVDGLAVAYLDDHRGKRSLILWRDLERLGWSRRELRECAIDGLDRRYEAVQVHGGPPALMLSFGGLESSLLLLDAVWDEFSGVVPGDVVVGVPARDVLIVTGTDSPPGLMRVRRAVDRVFLSGHRFPLSPHLLVRRGRRWEKLSAVRSASRMN